MKYIIVDPTYVDPFKGKMVHYQEFEAEDDSAAKKFWEEQHRDYGKIYQNIFPNAKLYKPLE